MSNKNYLAVLVVALIFSIFVHQGIGVAQSSFEKLLTVSDVEKVTGLKGIKLLPRDSSKGRHGDLNFYQQDGTIVVGVSITQGERAQAVWKGWTEQMAIIKDQGGKATKVTGAGDEAFESEIVMGEISFYFRKGKSAVYISSVADVMKNKMEPLLSLGQVRELAKIIASRL